MGLNAVIPTSMITAIVLIGGAAAGLGVTYIHLKASTLEIMTGLPRKVYMLSVKVHFSLDKKENVLLFVFSFLKLRKCRTL